MNALISLLAASALAGFDLAVLAWMCSRLGAGPKGGQSVTLGLLVVLKLAILAAGVAWLAHQPWNDRRAMIAGLLAPFALFIAWQVLRLQSRAQKRA
ncbi:MAG TPA: hypothetical protein VK914_03530 [bacterium]|jgi:hypothetical protein|nr:hypothetical protein [bacterium]